MLTREDNELLTRTGPDTPMGALFRRFWQPVALAEEVATPDEPPKRVRYMGEDFLLFRQTDGKIGLVEPRCAHRGADLYFGRNEDCGLRCVYHGWKFDADGGCVDIPNMQPGRARDNIMKSARIRSLPVREWGGQIWAWFGEPDAAPELPLVEWALVPPQNRYVSKKLQECNWAQSLEGAVDTAHFSYVHRVLSEEGTGKPVYLDKRQQWIHDDGAPTFVVEEHEAGLVMGGARKADPGETYWRISQFLTPNHSLAPGTFPGEPYAAQSWMPVDDENCWIFTVTWCPDRPISDDELDRYENGRSVHAMVDEDYVPLRNRGNEYLLDRDLQKTKLFMGITGLSEQDAAIQDSQGRIAPRDREILTPSDEGVIRFRKLMIKRARDLQIGIEPPEVQVPEAYATHSGGAVAPEGQSFVEVLKERFGDDRGRAPDLLPGAAAAE
ncbi:Rieske 2Fe-2S domain-containing protein [Minwuia sp.]|uniref:Rieske 2Fe-2S domain-containing protein n=1 Tax=Minwuia sp. TaxID=2493630 RepID=UPI003A912B94